MQARARAEASQMLAFIGSLVVFLREIFLAVTSTRDFIHWNEVNRTDSERPLPAGPRSHNESRVRSSEDVRT